MPFIAGGYTATLDGTSLGQIEAGVEIEFQIFKRLIKGDNMADAPQDAIFRGLEMMLAYTLLEYDASAADLAMNPYGTDWLNFGVVGRLDNTGAAPLGKQLILTAVTGTPAAASPATLTFPKVALHENFPVKLLFAPDLRTVPIKQRVYPSTSRVFGTQT